MRSSVLLSLVVALLWAPAAHAATVAVSGTTVTITADPGEANQLTVGTSSGQLSVTDAGAPLTAGAGCTTAGAAVRCPLPTAVTADLGDGDDTLAMTTSRPLTATDGPGDDRVTGSGAADTFLASPGSDLYQGGNGSDTVSYAARVEPVVVDLAGTNEDSFSSVENAIGGSGSDRLLGTTGANRLEGGPGDDVLDGRVGADQLHGGAGVDTADFSARTVNVTADLDGNADDGQAYERDRIAVDVERLLGGTGNDTLTGNTGPNVLEGGAGNDRLAGAPGDDTLAGGEGVDALSGGDGDDTLAGEGGNDSIVGDNGGDRLAGGPGDDGIAGGAGHDTASGGDGNDTLSGADGSDALYGEAGDDTANGDGGDDALDGGAGNDTLAGGEGHDRLSGATENDALDGGNGDDAVDGGPGDDRVVGGAGADAVTGAEGNDELHGGTEADRLSGGDGDDRLLGGSEDDVLTGGAGADDLAGEDGWDTADYASRPEALTIDLDDEADDGARGEGDNARSTVESVIGGAAGDRITGNAGVNYLYGEGGGDRLVGGAGSDRLFGGAGGDHMTGGAGADSLDGAAGDDTLHARGGSREAVRCGSGRDRAIADVVDMLFGCEVRSRGTANWSSRDPAASGRVRGVRARTGGGRFVEIPGFPGERIDRRLLPDIAYLVRRFKVRIVDGYARRGHAAAGEHPVGLAVDIVPGVGGSWADVDRLAKWAEPRQNRPRSPFRWVGYNGDKNHGRGNHLHLSWRHSATKPGRPAKTVYTLDISR